MKEQKKEGGKSRTRFPDALDGSSHPTIDCGNQYSTSVSALQGEIEEKFQPKKKRSLRLAELYTELSQMCKAEAEALFAEFDRNYIEADDFATEVDNIETLAAKVMAGDDEAFNQEYEAYVRRGAFAQRQAEIFRGRADRVENCGTLLEFRLTEQEKRLHKGNFCKDRFCPMCNWRRSLKIFGQVSQIMDVLEARGYRFLFLTVSVRNALPDISGDNFFTAVQTMYDGWRTLYNNYFRKNKTLKDVICGTFRSFEVTINKERKCDNGSPNPWYGSFHPHFHVILAVKPEYFHKAYVKQEQWVEMWRVCCGLDYEPTVDIRTIKPKPDKKNGETSIAGAVSEVSKYTVKDKDYLGLDDDGRDSRQLDILGLDRTYYLRVLALGLKGRRLVDMTGCFREVKSRLGLDDTENGDLVHVEKEEIREDIAYLIVKYQWRNGVYVATYKEHEPTMEDRLKAIGNLAPTAEEAENL